MADWTPSILLFAFAGLVAWYGVHLIRQARQGFRFGEASLRWPMAAGRITASGVQFDDHGEGVVNYYPTVAYTYSVGTASLTGNTVAFRAPMMSKRAAEAIIAKYPVGSEANVYYDPDDPRLCVLEPGVVGNWWILICGVITIAVAALGVAAGIVIPLILRR